MGFGRGKGFTSKGRTETVKVNIAYLAGQAKTAAESNPDYTVEVS